MVSTDVKIALLSRTDDTRGPLGVAKEVNSRLIGRQNCHVIDVVGARGLLKALMWVLFKAHDYSVCVHANGFRLPLLLCIIAALNKRNRYFCVLHGVVNEEKKYRPVARKDIKLESFIFRKFQNVICVSDFEKMRLFDLYGFRDRVSVIHNGVNFKMNFKQHKVELSLLESVCITTGGFEQRKAVDLALKTLSELSKLGCKPTLIVCGRDSVETGSNRLLCEQMAFESGIELIYKGEIGDKSDLNDLYQEAHFYMGLSRFDTFNCSVLEGAAAGCVPVVSKTCGASELFDASSSIICDIESSDFAYVAAKKMYELIKNEPAFSAASENAVKVAKSNTWDVVSANYWKLLANG